MPRYNVEHDGKWACFSSISDGFITEFMDKEEYEEWRKSAYGIRNYEPAENCNMMTIKEATLSIRLNRNHQQSLEVLLESGLPKEECKKILYDTEKVYFCPVPKGDGIYSCPNCNKEVKREQDECEGEYCGLTFTWLV